VVCIESDSRENEQGDMIAMMAYGMAGVFAQAGGVFLALQNDIQQTMLYLSKR